MEMDFYSLPVKWSMGEESYVFRNTVWRVGTPGPSGRSAQYLMSRGKIRPTDLEFWPKAIFESTSDFAIKRSTWASFCERRLAFGNSKLCLRCLDCNARKITNPWLKKNVPYFSDCEWILSWSNPQDSMFLYECQTDVALVYRDCGISHIPAPTIFITEVSEGRKIVTGICSCRLEERGEAARPPRDEAGGDGTAPTKRSSFVRYKKKRWRKNYRKCKCLWWLIKMMMMKIVMVYDDW